MSGLEGLWNKTGARTPRYRNGRKRWLRCGVRWKFAASLHLFCSF